MPKFLLDQLARERHQALAQLLVPSQLAPGLGDRGGTDIFASLFRGGGTIEGGDGALPLVLLEGLHGDAHGVAGDGVGLVDVAGAHFRLDEARVGRGSGRRGGWRVWSGRIGRWGRGRG